MQPEKHNLKRNVHGTTLFTSKEASLSEEILAKHQANLCVWPRCQVESNLKLRRYLALVLAV